MQSSYGQSKQSILMMIPFIQVFSLTEETLNESPSSSFGIQFPFDYVARNSR